MWTPGCQNLGVHHDQLQITVLKLKKKKRILQGQDRCVERCKSGTLRPGNGNSRNAPFCLETPRVPRALSTVNLVDLGAEIPGGDLVGLGAGLHSWESIFVVTGITPITCPNWCKLEDRALNFTHFRSLPRVCQEIGAGAFDTNSVLSALGKAQGLNSGNSVVAMAVRTISTLTESCQMMVIHYCSQG